MGKAPEMTIEPQGALQLNVILSALYFEPGLNFFHSRLSVSFSVSDF